MIFFFNFQLNQTLFVPKRMDISRIPSSVTNITTVMMESQRNVSVLTV